MKGKYRPHAGVNQIKGLSIPASELPTEVNA